MTTHPSPQEHELLLRARAGDRQAFDALMTLKADLVYRVVWRILRNDQDAQDAFQDVFLRVFQHLPSFRGECEFHHWLKRIAINVALTHLKKKQRQSTQPLFETAEAESLPEALQEPAGQEANLIRSHHSALLNRGFKRLSPKEHTAVMLRLERDIPIRDIASLMGCSTGAIKSYLFRATRKLRQYMATETKQSPSTPMATPPKEAP